MATALLRRLALSLLLASGAALVVVAGAPSLAQTPDDELEPLEGDIDAGRELYLVSCAVCHGAEGEGIPPWPPIVDAGAAAAHFQLTTGRMPFAQAPGEQPMRKPPAFDDEQIADLVAYVALLGDGPPIPEVEIDPDLLPFGHDLYVANCAPCHGTTAAGGAVGGGALAPGLGEVEPVTVVEAMITGPGQMPVFDYPDEARNAVATYVEYLRRSDAPGGLSIGQIGPVPEGFVGWLVGMGGLILIVYLIGREWQRKQDPATPQPLEERDAGDDR